SCTAALHSHSLDSWEHAALHRPEGQIPPSAQLSAEWHAALPRAAALAGPPVAVPGCSAQSVAARAEERLLRDLALDLPRPTHPSSPLGSPARPCWPRWSLSA